MSNTIHQFSTAKRAFTFAEKEILMGRTCKVGMQGGLWEVEPLSAEQPRPAYQDNKPTVIATAEQLKNLAPGRYTVIGEASAELSRQQFRMLERQNNPCGGKSE